MPRKVQRWTRKKLHRERLRREAEAKEAHRIGKAIGRRHNRALRKVDQVLASDDAVEDLGPSPSYPMSKRVRYGRNSG